ncbi:SMI1/KNR4 family protein [Nocardia sp. NPDC057668]|uniref:SMI1/KNR4 family protein n=1 Tax=Nocardia sp. NPDC057668 TaxID=3346202 RepID=UPI003672D6E9
MRALDVFNDYVAWLRDNVPLAYENLAGPARPRQLAMLERAIGRPLPAEVAAVLSVHNGQIDSAVGDYDHGVPCIPTLVFMSTREIRRTWQLWDSVKDDPATQSLQSSGMVYPAAQGKIKPLYSSPGWIPLWSDPTRPDYIGLDFDPGPAGTPGQIINFGRNEECHHLCAPTYTDLLEFLLAEVASGAWPATEIVEDDDDRDPLPWFGEPRSSFFNALHDRFEPQRRD